MVICNYVFLKPLRFTLKSFNFKNEKQNTHQHFYQKGDRLSQFPLKSLYYRVLGVQIHNTSNNLRQLLTYISIPNKLTQNINIFSLYIFMEPSLIIFETVHTKL